VLPVMMFCFGGATLLAASVKNWGGYDGVEVVFR
jgi:hypothetical protein